MKQSLLLCVAVCLAVISTPGSALAEKPSILVVGIAEAGVENFIEPQYQKDLNKLGYHVDTAHYRQLNWEKMKNFNVLLLAWAPGYGQAEGVAAYEALIPLYRRFLRAGGGILVMAAPRYDSQKIVNRFLATLGAELLCESLLDEKLVYRQKAYLQWHFGSTTNIQPHPITAGVRGISYPVGHSRKAIDTMPLRLSWDWQVAVKAAASTRSSGGTYDSAPPIVAARSFAGGRVVVFSSHATYWITDPNHRVWEGICIGRGDGARLLSNIYDWLGEPSLQSGQLGGFRQAATIKKPKPKKKPSVQYDVLATDIYTQILDRGVRKPVTKLEHKKRALNTYTGVIGVFSTYSSGTGRVAEYADAARKAGHDFIVFTEAFEQMDAEKWRSLAEDCKRVSDDSFLAMGGLSYQDTYGNNYILFNAPQWPEEKWLDESGKRVKDLPGLYFGLDWVPLYVVNAGKNPTRPWFLKFYSGLALFSYSRDGQLMDDDFDGYLTVQGSNYNLIPIAYHQVHSPDELAGVKGRKTCVLAEDVADIPGGLKYFWYTPRRTYVSDGPKILEFAIENGWTAARQEPWGLYIEAASDHDIEEVIVYDRREIYRRFRPGQKSFSVELHGYHDKQRHFTMVVRDSAGRQAISPTLYTTDLRQATYMCTDLQNTLNSMADLSADGRLLRYFVMGNYVTGWDSLKPGVVVPAKHVMPSGLDYVINGFSGAVSHRIFSTEGTESGVARLDMVFNSGDVNMLDNHFRTKLLPGSRLVPTELADSTVRFSTFTPQPYSYVMMIVESETTFKNDFTFADRSGPELVKLFVTGPAESFSHYTYIGPDGMKISRQRDDGASVLDGILKKGGYVALWPDFYGSVAIYPLSDEQYTFTIRDANIEIGRELAGSKAVAGTKVVDAFLVVRGKFGEPDDKGFDRIRDVYGFDGQPAYQINVTHGRLIDATLTPTMEAEDYYLEASVSRADLPNELGVAVRGLNANWDAGLVQAGSEDIRRIGVLKDAGYFTLNTSQKHELKAGNLLVCDNQAVRLVLTGYSADQITFEAHNPTDNETAVTVTSPFFKALREQCKLPPAASRIFTVQRSIPVHGADAR
ncbi:MAG: hypothetical protein SVT52_01035 [Planctomycetota bacterium]|nr:hypothetical protein [Planctomycetota bacterium]